MMKPHDSELPRSSVCATVGCSAEAEEEPLHLAVVVLAVEVFQASVEEVVFQEASVEAAEVQHPKAETLAAITVDAEADKLWSCLKPVISSFDVV